MSNVAEELAKGGAYAAWLIVTIEAGVIVFLFRELIKALKEDGAEMAEGLNKVNQTQVQHTMALNTMLDMLKTIQSVFMSGGQK